MRIITFEMDDGFSAAAYVTLLAKMWANYTVADPQLGEYTVKDFLPLTSTEALMFGMLMGEMSKASEKEEGGNL